MYFAYSLLLALGAIFLFPFFLIQGLRKGKYLSSFRARLGRVPPEVCATSRTECAGGANVTKDAIWLHAVSVGEVLACQGLVAALKDRFPARPLVVSTTTETGFDAARRRLGADGVFYCPFDFAFAVRRVLRAVRPALLVVAETEFWPNLFYHAWRAGVPTAVVNTRISDRSFPRYRRFRFLFRDVLNRTTLLLAQSDVDACRLRDLGVADSRVRVTGNLKYDQCSAAPLPDWLDRQVRAWAADGVLLAGSTAAGEETTVFSAFRSLRAAHPGLRLILAPRRPERFAEVAELAVSFGFGVARRSELAEDPVSAQRSESAADRESALRDSAEVLLLDTVGELSGFYRYATVAFVGGSLVPHGGQNILEAAQFARPIVVGPYMSNLREMTEAFRTAGALRQVRSSSELLPALVELFANPDLARSMGESARCLLETNRGATSRTVELLATLLERREPAVERA
jgi:3-deoxy-D-manno-octulosonic-acid transferase